MNTLFEKFLNLVKMYLYQEYYKVKTKRKIKSYFKKIVQKEEYSYQEFVFFLEKLKQELDQDLKMYILNDPAVLSKEEVVRCNLGFFAIFVYRIAHEFYVHNLRLQARIMSEIAHSKTAIDIHPAAIIGKSFFIDHGTGIVIGETTLIGDNVKLYQGVTLGVKSLKFNLKGQKRHPTIGDNVTIFAYATILGGNTIIGSNSIIGCHTVIDESIKPNSKIKLSNLLK